MIILHSPFSILHSSIVTIQSSPHKQGFVGEGDGPLRPFGAPPLKRGGKATARQRGLLGSPFGGAGAARSA